MGNQAWAGVLLTGLFAVVVGIGLFATQTLPTAASHDWEHGLILLAVALAAGAVALLIPQLLT
jgi:hypothetical protein